MPFPVCTQATVMLAIIRDFPLFVRILLVIGPLTGILVWSHLRSGTTPAQTEVAAIRPALTVTATAPEHARWSRTLPANGSIAAWQESVIGAEIDGYRIVSVDVRVGDRVRKGQVLARIAAETVASELAQARATLTEQEAMATEAAGNAVRARQLKDRGFYSHQMHAQYQTAENTAAARLEGARARLQAAEIRMAKTVVVAPDDGILSAATATVGSLTRNGQELFRLIRGGHLEWQAEVPADVLPQIEPGTSATVRTASGERVNGLVGRVSPSADTRTRNGLVYVRLAAPDMLRAGMFARGELELGRAPAMTLPRAAVVQREGFAYVFRIEDGQDDIRRVTQAKVELGRRQGDRIEIVSGLSSDALVVSGGVGFLADGDTVRLVSGSSGQ